MDLTSLSRFDLEIGADLHWLRPAVEEKPSSLSSANQERTSIAFAFGNNSRKCPNKTFAQRPEKTDSLTPGSILAMATAVQTNMVGILRRFHLHPMDAALNELNTSSSLAHLRKFVSSPFVLSIALSLTESSSVPIS
ncbi:hypothetical protein P879_10226 [Paragonimus westermani]|uniref:Uncharacterized protein n=1 Tax=Paragonimus westermani TaxID=34504 RepID=A0A8T0D774_9TREM|nr:hypothetical protein P879_10226 [Paragonimus westermani]